MNPALLLPSPDEFSVTGVALLDHGIDVGIVSLRKSATCPRCGVPARRVHSHYTRRLCDLPWGERTVRLILRARRFFCDEALCGQRIFTERVPTLAEPWSRRTSRLAAALQILGLALGGEAGSRLAARLRMAVSGDTLIRLVLKVPLKDEHVAEIIGVDDWAWRKGQSYGTILVDLERHRVLDLLPDRTADALTDWLRQHAGVRVIARDRAGAYADGARRGAPKAIQVADRWHLLVNLTEALKRMIARRWHRLKPHLVSPPSQDSPTMPVEVLQEPKLSAPARHAQVSRARRHDRFEELRRLHAEGVSIRELTRRFGMGRRTVRNFLRAESFPERTSGASRPTLLTPHLSYLRERWEAGCTNGAQLFRELQAHGYKGSRSYLSQWVAVERKKLPHPPQKASTLAHPVSMRPPSLRQVVWQLIRPAEQLSAAEKETISRWCQACPQVALGQGLSQSFTRMAKGDRSIKLAEWLEAAENSGIVEFKGLAQSIRRDQDAVEQAFVSEWSSGQVEGHNHRLKLLKRQMYGKASFELLRRRVLNPA